MVSNLALVATIPSHREANKAWSTCVEVLWASPGINIQLMLPFLWRELRWSNLTVREAGKCSLAMCTGGRGEQRLVDSYQSAADFWKDIRKTTMSICIGYQFIERLGEHIHTLAIVEKVHNQITVFTYLSIYYNPICTFIHSNYYFPKESKNIILRQVISSWSGKVYIAFFSFFSSLHLYWVSLKRNKHLYSPKPTWLPPLVS